MKGRRGTVAVKIGVMRFGQPSTFDMERAEELGERRRERRKIESEGGERGRKQKRKKLGERKSNERGKTGQVSPGTRVLDSAFSRVSSPGCWAVYGTMV